MSSGKVPLPSAPPPGEDEGSSNGYRQPAEAPPQPNIVTSSHVTAPTPPAPMPPPGFHDADAPPSYQAALGMTNHANPPYPEHGHVPPKTPHHTVPMFPAPPYQPQQLNPQLIPVSTPVIIHTSTVHQPRGDCTFCQTGHVRNETDFCCLLCLIIIAVFTFPFGLLLLCCIPCTVRKRCNRCRRIY